MSVPRKCPIFRPASSGENQLTDTTAELGVAATQLAWWEVGTRGVGIAPRQDMSNATAPTLWELWTSMEKLSEA